MAAIVRRSNFAAKRVDRLLRAVVPIGRVFRRRLGRHDYDRVADSPSGRLLKFNVLRAVCRGSREPRPSGFACALQIELPRADDPEPDVGWNRVHAAADAFRFVDAGEAERVHLRRRRRLHAQHTIDDDVAGAFERAVLILGELERRGWADKQAGDRSLFGIEGDRVPFANEGQILRRGHASAPSRRVSCPTSRSRASAWAAELPCRDHASKVRHRAGAFHRFARSEPGLLLQSRPKPRGGIYVAKRRACAASR